MKTTYRFSDEPILPRLTPSPPTTPPPPRPTPSPPAPANRSIYALTHKPGWRVTVTAYDSNWPRQFIEIAASLTQTFSEAEHPIHPCIEHIGSTSVPGLCAKPNIDILITVPNADDLHLVVEALNWEVPRRPPFTRYTQVPNGGGIKGRESFKLYIPPESEWAHTTPERSVYVIDTSSDNEAGNVQVRCYRTVRDTLRQARNADLRDEYAALKWALARNTFDNAFEYSAAKDGVVRKILLRGGWSEHEVDRREVFSRRVWSDPDDLPY